MTDIKARTEPTLSGVPSNPAVPLSIIPKERYISPEFAKLEAEHLWTRVWQMACRVDDVPTPGDFFEYRILDQSILIVRQLDGSLKAIYNACRHRGLPLACGSGTVDEFRCSFHGWTYAIDGSLKFVLSPDEFPCTAQYSLAECAVDTWGGFVFVNLDPSPQPLTDFLASVESHLAPYHYEDLVMTRAVTMVFPCNWKAAMDPFIESYHVAATHPQLLLSIDDVNTQYDNVGIHSRMDIPMFTSSPRAGEVTEEAIFEDLVEQLEGIGFTQFSGFSLPEGMSVRDFVRQMNHQTADAQGFDVSGLDEDQMVNIDCWLLFPNLCLQATATETLAWRVLPNGDDPDSCLLTQYMLRSAAPDAPRDPVKQEFFENWRDFDCGLALSQDYENLMLIQQGMHQRGFTGLLLAQNQERRIAHMHDVIDSYVKGS